MKCSFGISDFLEEISSLSHSVAFLYFFALIAEEGFQPQVHMCPHFLNPPPSHPIRLACPRALALGALLCTSNLQWGRQVLNQWTTREVTSFFFLFFILSAVCDMLKIILH